MREDLIEYLARFAIPSNGVPTSDAARESIRADVGRMRHTVLFAIREEKDGLTCDELEIITGYSHQTASARVNELHKAGRIADSGLRRKTRSGRKAIVWKEVLDQ